MRSGIPFRTVDWWCHDKMEVGVKLYKRKKVHEQASNLITVECNKLAV